MKFKATLTVLLLGAMPSISWAQPAPMRRASELTFDYLVMAQVDPNNTQTIIVTVDTYRVQRRTVVEPESRLRLDTADEKTLLLKYSRGRSATVKPNTMVGIIPEGNKQVEIARQEIRFYTLDRELLSSADTAKLLQAPRPTFLFDDTRAGPPNISDVYRQALHSDCLIAITENRIRESVTEALPDSRPEPSKPLPE